MVDTARINETMGKMAHYLNTHDAISVGVSGGSDSNIIVHMLATYFREYLPKIKFVFINTGLEYRATIKHLDYIEQRYNIHIDKIRGKSVVSAIHEEGFPIISKDFSEILYYAMQGKDWALTRVHRTKEESPYAFSKKKKDLANYILDNNIKISSRCCDVSKKKPNLIYCKENNIDLKISGERQCEGGMRATIHSSCFEKASSKYKIDKYMPLFFWDDETKSYYKESEGIVYSDCYEVWGMERTGCVGCPFNSKVGRDLKLIKQYETGVYKACLNIFGESYELMDKFNVRRQKILDENMIVDLNEIKTKTQKRKELTNAV